MTFLVQPRLINGPFDDPGAFIDFRFGRRAFLFDLGDLSPLASRELLRVTHVFVSHAHLDHIAGFDRLLRVQLHRPGCLTLIGPLGFTRQIDCRLRSVTWNLLDERSVDFRLQVHEFDGLKMSAPAVFPARRKFRPYAGQLCPYPDGVVWTEPNLEVRSIALDHGTPSLAFALREGKQVNVWRSELDALGLRPGPWLGQAKRAIVAGELDRALDVPGAGRVELADLQARVFRVQRGQRVAYVTDAADTSTNRASIVDLAQDADTLFIEATFAHEDRLIAEATHHLTARAAGEIARQARIRRLVTFHHSARYLSTPTRLDDEAQRSFLK